MTNRFFFRCLLACTLAVFASWTTPAAAELVLGDPVSELYFEILIAAGQGVQVEGGAVLDGPVHGNGDVDVKAGATLSGPVSAVGRVRNRGEILGDVSEGTEPVALPGLSSAQQWRLLADQVLEGDQVLRDPVLDGVLFVTGEAVVFGELAGSGTLVAQNLNLQGLNAGGGTARDRAGGIFSLIAFEDLRVGQGRTLRGALQAGRDLSFEKEVTFAGVAIAGGRLHVKKDARLEFFDLDEAGPEIALFAPPADGFVGDARPEILIELRDTLSQPRALRLLLDGDDLLSAAEITTDRLVTLLRLTPSEPLTDGPHLLEVEAEDRSGNQTRAPFSFTVDTEPPTLAVVSPTATVQDEVPPVVVEYSDAGSGLDLATLSVDVDGIDLTAACVIGEAAATCTVPELSEGDHLVTARVSDLVGRGGDASSAFQLDLLPRLSIVSPEPTVFVDPTLLQPVPDVVMTYEDVVPGLDLESLEVLLDNLDDRSEALDMETLCTVEPTSATCAVPLLGEGSFELTASIADLGGRSTTELAVFGVDISTDEAPPDLVVVEPADGAALGEPRVVVRGTVTDDDVLARLLVNSESVEVAEDGSFDLTLELIGGGDGVYPIQILAFDFAGKTSEVVRSVRVDSVPPGITVEEPAEGAVTSAPAITVAGRVVNDEEGPVDLRVSGLAVPVAADGSFSSEVPLAEGRQLVELVARDAAGNEERAGVPVFRFVAPTVEILEPADGDLVSAEQVAVSGTVSPAGTTVTVNGVTAQLSGGAFTATVPVAIGRALVTAVAESPAGSVTTASIHVLRDAEAPRIVLTHPAGGTVVHQAGTVVTGRVEDALGEGPGAVQVTVAGEPVEVRRGAFRAEVALSPGASTVTAEALDTAGNRASAVLDLVFEPLVGEPLVEAVSGDLQSAVVGTEVPAPLVARLLDANGDPAAGETVVFRVVSDNGVLSGGGRTARAVAVTTGADGLASAGWTLGRRAGLGLQRVEARAVGFAGAATFTADALPGPAARLFIDGGQGQTGAVDQPLTEPFVAVVTDAFQNPVSGAEVTFRVLRGEGSFADEPEVRVPTDGAGRSEALLTLGPGEGQDNHAVTAELGEDRVLFLASGLVPGDPAQTRLSGVVLDNAEQPVPGVTVRVEGSAASTRTGPSGAFVLEPVPVGVVTVVADGSTAERPGAWPVLAFEETTVAGRETVMERPVFLLPIDVERGVEVGPDTGATLTLAEVPGFALEVEPGAARFGDGGQSGRVSVTGVHADKVPMLPRRGQQPRFVVTVQPPDVHFDPPAVLQLPNVEGLPPGTATELFSFRHDLGEFVSIGPAVVSEDGSVIRSAPGFGLTAGGWHHAPPDTAESEEEGDTCGGCPECKSMCILGGCGIASSDIDAPCDDNLFCTEESFCSGGECKGTPIADAEFTASLDPRALVEGFATAVNSISSITESACTGSASLSPVVEGSLVGFNRCCEESDSFRGGHRVEATAGLSFSTPTCAVPGVSVVIPGVVSAGVLVGASFKGTFTLDGDSNPCDSIPTCSEPFIKFGQIEVKLKVALGAILIDPDIFDVEAISASWGGILLVQGDCDGIDLSGKVGPVVVEFLTVELFGGISFSIKKELTFLQWTF